MPLRHYPLRAILLTLLLFLLSFWTMPIFSAAASDASWLLYDENIYYTTTSRGEVTIKSARASVTEAEIPAEIDGCPVTEIGSFAFKDCSRLTRAVLPKTIRKIGEFAFQNCNRLTDLTIPDEVEQVGWGIVQGTPWLEQQQDDFVIAGQEILLAYQGSDANVVVPNGVRAIGGYAFASCDTMRAVTLPDSLLSIDAFAFDKCSNLLEVCMADGVTTIGEYAFHWCVSLLNISLPDTVETIGNHAFSFCKSMEEAKLPASLKQISNTMFSGCKALTMVEIPDGVTVISNYAFQNCAALTDVVIPESVMEIGAGAFDGCFNLKQLSIRNGACRIYDAEQTIAASAKIKGLVGSTAHVYAQKYQRDFLALDGMKGDYDGDSEITINDAFLVLMLSSNISAGLTQALSPAKMYAADYDSNGIITINDAFQILMVHSYHAVGGKDDN